MSLPTTRLGSTESEPHSLEVDIQLPSASILLWHLSRLPGLQVVAKKSWAMTDDFEAFFLYKGRLFVMETPFVNVCVSLLGNPSDEQLFSEIENQVKGFNRWMMLLFPLAIVRYIFVPFNPSQNLLKRHGVAANSQSSAGKGNAL